MTLQGGHTPKWVRPWDAQVLPGRCGDEDMETAGERNAAYALPSRLHDDQIAVIVLASGSSVPGTLW